jgi:branched-chain amino acid transport system permease protein
LTGAFRLSHLAFPIDRLFVIGVAFALAGALWFLLERSRLGAMIRAGVDDLTMARAMGIRTSLLFSVVFCLGSALAGAGGVLSGPILSVYPGLDTDMLPLALVVVILGGVGSLLGAFVGSLIIGFIYSYGQALFPDLAYVILFLPMVLVLTLRPTGLFGRQAI